MKLSVSSILIPVILAIPTPTPAGEPVHCLRASVEQACDSTPTPEAVRRGLGDRISSYVDGIISQAESGVSSFVGSGILDYPTGFPTGSAVQSSLGISSSDLEALPTQVLNLP